MKNRDGYALIAALWFLVLGSAISLEAAHAARKHRLLAAGLSEGAQARTAAAAGIESPAAAVENAGDGIYRPTRPTALIPEVVVPLTVAGTAIARGFGALATLVDRGERPEAVY